MTVRSLSGNNILLEHRRRSHAYVPSALRGLAGGVAVELQ
jgi:hypothetical protein